MAKKKAANGGINKSELIRAFKAGNPDAMPKAIAEAINKQHGIKVTPQTVSTVLSNANKKKGNTNSGGKRAGKAGSNGKPMASRFIDAADAIQMLKTASDVLGGAEKAKRVLDLIS